MRSIWKAYKEGLLLVVRRKRIWAILFIVNLLAALLLALPFQSYMATTAGHSMALSYDLGRFDFTFLGDLMNEYGDGIGVIFGLSKYIIIIYLILGVFLNGGLIGSIIQGNRREKPSFFHDCGYYFWRMIRLSLLFLLVYALIASISWLVFKSMIGGLSPFNWSSDGHLIRSFYLVFFIMLTLFFVAMIVHDYAKIHLVRTDAQGVWKAIKLGFNFVRHNALKCSILYATHLVSFGLLFLIYRNLRCLLPINGIITVLCLFVLGQMFIWFRIGIKFHNLASAERLIKNITL